MAVWNFKNLHFIFLIGKRRYGFMAPWELVPLYNTGNPYAAIRTKAPYGYQAKLFQFHVLVRVCVRAHIRVLLPVFNPVLVRVLICMCVRVDLNTAL
jgi:hypothetical protein